MKGAPLKMPSMLLLRTLVPLLAVRIDLLLAEPLHRLHDAALLLVVKAVGQLGGEIDRAEPRPSRAAPAPPPHQQPPRALQHSTAKKNTVYLT